MTLVAEYSSKIFLNVNIVFSMNEVARIKTMVREGLCHTEISELLFRCICSIHGRISLIILTTYYHNYISILYMNYSIIM